MIKRNDETARVKLMISGHCHRIYKMLSIYVLSRKGILDKEWGMDLKWVNSTSCDSLTLRATWSFLWEFGNNNIGWRIKDFYFFMGSSTCNCNLVREHFAITHYYFRFVVICFRFRSLWNRNANHVAVMYKLFNYYSRKVRSFTCNLITQKFTNK